MEKLRILVWRCSVAWIVRRRWKTSWERALEAGWSESDEELADRESPLDTVLTWESYADNCA